MKHGYLVFLVFGIAVLSSCNIINRDEPEAAYIAIDTVTVQTDNDIQGSPSAKITDAWIYVDDNLVGAFPLPCRIPVLKTGDHKVSIGAGIQVNGSSTLRTPYIYYRFYTLESVTLTAGETTELHPTVTYFDSLTFPFKANFDDISGNKLTASASSDTTAGLTNNPALVYEGNGSFRMQLLRDSGLVDVEMIESVVLPKNSTTIYMEMNYKTNVDLVVGLRANYTGASTVDNTILTLRANDRWNKVYINLTKPVNTQVNASSFRVYFAAFKASGTAPLDVFLDNLKIVY
jgi:hypothetical protein